MAKNMEITVLCGVSLTGPSKSPFKGVLENICIYIYI